MKAAVCYELGKPLVVDEIDVDPPQAGEVRVRTAACAICHSDIHLVRGEWGGRPPLVPGHEAAGIVEAVGAGVTTVQPGDRVVVSLLRSCGRCFYCQSGSPHQCEADYALNHETRLHARNGEPIRQSSNTAGFAEVLVVEQSQCVPLPEEMPLDRACLLACGVITGLGAVVNTAKVRPGQNVVVIGAGGVGLNAVQGAVLSGAFPIIAVDLLDSKLEAARVFGATHTFNAQRERQLHRAVQGWTAGRGADYVFVTVGSASAVEQGFRLLRRGGTAVVVGIPGRGAEVTLPVGRFVSERTLTGSSMGSTRLSVDVPKLVALYLAGRLKLDELITARYPLEQINEAIEAVERGEALRNVIVFEGEEPARAGLSGLS